VSTMVSATWKSFCSVVFHAWRVVRDAPCLGVSSCHIVSRGVVQCGVSVWCACMCVGACVRARVRLCPCDGSIALFQFESDCEFECGSKRCCLEIEANLSKFSALTVEPVLCAFNCVFNRVFSILLLCRLCAWLRCLAVLPSHPTPLSHAVCLYR